MSALIPRLTSSLLLVIFTLAAPRAYVAGDWAEWRGPSRDGFSAEKNLPEKWSPAGDNLAWKVPYGGRSAPVVLGDRVYLLNTAGSGADEQERVMCFDADTGRILWEHRFNVYLSDVPPHRVGWASPAGDPATGNVYALGVGGTLLAFTRDGDVVWERSLGEDFALLTTHGGRTVSPIIDGELVIVSGITFQWGEHGRGTHRWLAFDKRTGETVYISAPGSRPYDTTYAPPVIAKVAGTRLLIQGGSDGFIHAIKPQTGEPVWRVEISKRGINTGVVVQDTTAIITHSEENLDRSEMGMIAAVDASSRGEIQKERARWVRYGWLGGFSSPVLDGERIYQIDNGANLAAFDAKTGRQLWLHNLGTIQKASPVLADGKLYVGTENGKFFIIRPSADGARVLDEDQLGTESSPEAILASAAVADGRIYVVSDAALYAIGKRRREKSSVSARNQPERAPASAAVAHVQVVPTELILKEGEEVNFKARLFDDKGRLIREETNAGWTLEGIGGSIADGGRYVAPKTQKPQAGRVRAVVAGVSGAAFVRAFPPIPWAEDFESLTTDATPPYWTGTTLKYLVRQRDSNRLLEKISGGSSLLSRARAYVGPSDLKDYTVEADVRAVERRRQMGDAGIIAQRYALVLYGNAQRLHLEPWQPETERTVTVPFEWVKDAWYRMKLRVENLEGGRVRARGKVWPAGAPEPEAWTIERIDPKGNRRGTPGLFGNALNEVYFDNFKVYPNE